MPSRIDLSGQKFGKLLIKNQAESQGVRSAWFCLCDCGAECTVTTTMLRSYGKTSCGCDTFSKKSASISTHGLSKTPTYKTWSMMKSRCFNKKYSHYSYYGGRGITVCDRWANSFDCFVQDMGIRPEGMTLDRIDPNGDYCAENCRWASRESQVDNRRSAVFFEMDGVSKTLKEWAVLYGTSRKRLYSYIYKGKTLSETINHLGLNLV